MLTLSLIECLRNTVQTVIHDSFTSFDKVCDRVLLIENFPCIDHSVTQPTLTWLIPLRMPLVPILPGPSMAEEAATPRQWWLAHHTALFSQALSTSVRRPSLLSKCTQAGDIETRFIQKYIGDLYI